MCVDETFEKKSDYDEYESQIQSGKAANLEEYLTVLSQVCTYDVQRSGEEKERLLHLEKRGIRIETTGRRQWPCPVLLT